MKRPRAADSLSTDGLGKICVNYAVNELVGLYDLS
jgi:hypothetical protein